MDLDYSPLFPMYNCMLIDIKTMFEKGFVMNNAIISEPKSFQVACTVASQISAAVASSQYGGQTVNRFDEVMAKYVTMSYIKILKDKLIDAINLSCSEDEITYNESLEEVVQKKLNLYVKLDNIDTIESTIRDNYKEFLDSEDLLEKVLSSTRKKIEKEVYDGIQSYEYQINTISSTNGQTPFCTVGFGLGTSTESRMIQKAILEVRMVGLGERHVTPVFPKLIFTICKGINFYPEDKNYDIKVMAMKCSSLRMYPDVLNYENVCKMAGGKVVYKDDEHRVVDIEKSSGYKNPMGCRSFLHIWINPETGKEEYDGRFNLGRL